MTSTGSYDDLFKKELAKYDHICDEIAQNIEAQEQLLLQIQVLYARNSSKEHLRKETFLTIYSVSGTFFSHAVAIQGDYTLYS